METVGFGVQGEDGEVAKLRAENAMLMQRVAALERKVAEGSAARETLQHIEAENAARARQGEQRFNEIEKRFAQHHDVVMRELQQQGSRILELEQQGALGEAMSGADSEAMLAEPAQVFQYWAHLLL